MKKNLIQRFSAKTGAQRVMMRSNSFRDQGLESTCSTHDTCVFLPPESTVDRLVALGQPSCIAVQEFTWLSYCGVYLVKANRSNLE